MLKLKIYNDYTLLEYNDKSLYSFIRSTLSYQVPSAEYSDKFKTGHWDGTISLYDGRNKRFPSGLTTFLIENLEKANIKYQVSDNRTPPTPTKKYDSDYGSRKLRDYQILGPQLIKQYGRGILAYATGSGKTLTLCEIITQLNVAPFFIVVPGISLLKQTAKEIENIISENNINIKVGRVGGGIFDLYEDGINVCTYQSALAAYNYKFVESKNQLVYDESSGDNVKKTIPQLKEDLKNAEKKQNKKLISKIQGQILNKETSAHNKQKLQKIIELSQCLIVDECHLASEIIEFISMKAINAYYKIGTSATPMRTDNQEIRIEGAIGRILHVVSSSELIKRDILCKPTILMFKLDSKSDNIGYQQCYSQCVVHNELRNNIIKQTAEYCFEHNTPTVILVERIEHGEILSKMINNSVFVPGKSKSPDDDDPSDEELDHRQKMLKKLANNEHILIATQWIYTGIDCPPMQCLILAGSSSSPITTFQQVGRVLRKSDETNKQFALIIDFYDYNKYLRKHSANRKKTYLIEKEYDLRII